MLCHVCPGWANRPRSFFPLSNQFCGIILNVDFCLYDKICRKISNRISDTPSTPTQSGENRNTSTYGLLCLQWAYCLVLLLCVQADDFRASYSNRRQLSQQLWAALINNNCQVFVFRKFVGLTKALKFYIRLVYSCKIVRNKIIILYINIYH